MAASPVRNWEKFRLLLWKNWILQWSCKWSMAFEMILPIAFISILVGLRLALSIRSWHQMIFSKIDLNNIENDHITQRSSEIYYSPKNPIFDEIVKTAVGRLNLTDYKSFDNSSALHSALMASNVLAGVQFDDSMFNISEFPNKLSFAIRHNANHTTWLVNRLFRAVDFDYSPAFEFWSNDNDHSSSGYVEIGFLSIQHAISMAYIKLASKAEELPEIIARRYPYPSYVADDLILGLGLILPLILLLCFIYPASILVKNVTLEKEKQLKEIMKMMGLQNWIHWSAWFVRAFVSWGISAIIICTLLKIPINNGASVLNYSSWAALLCFLLIYIAVNICFCFMFAIFFEKPSTAVAVGVLVWFLQFGPFVLYKTELFNAGIKWLCLLPNSALGVGVDIILQYEIMEEGLQMRHLFRPITLDDNALATYIGIMLLSGLIFLTICLYFEQIFPGEYGVPKKWYFLFTKSYWFGRQDFGVYMELKTSNLNRQNSANFEPEPTRKSAGLKLKNLNKKFGSKLAVKNLTFNMYEDEITVLLGHNGAGKTTTISMLCGMFPPTSGTAIVNGYNISTNTEEARASMGICPQHNVLFDEMSVANHIVFFSRLKGVRGESALQTEIQKYLSAVGLQNKANEKAKNLSGGMKRKLSMCCAFCGNTKIVLCDEPSSGMDPSSRRQLWDLLQKEKTGRTILLTTHFMDEADVLGDRIAIMCDGELKCYGSSFFLKKKYGSGYKLICVKEENCLTEEVTAYLKHFLPDVELGSDIGAELTYLLPEDHISKFENMLAALEQNSSKLHLSGYGIGISSMEEVFMKVGAETLQNLRTVSESMFDANIMESIDARLTNDLFMENSNLLKSYRLIVNQLFAMFLKNALVTWRNRLNILLQLLVSVVVIVLVLKQPAADRISYKGKLIKPIVFGLNQYPEATTVLEAHANPTENSLASNMSANYKSIVKSYGNHYNFEETGGKNFTDYIISLGQSKQFEINGQYITGASIAEQNITAWFNYQAYHSAPLSLNLIHNALAKSLLGLNTKIIVTNAPLPLTSVSESRPPMEDHCYILYVALCFVMCFVTSFYTIFVIKDRTSRAKLLQFVSGVGIWLYWITQFLWDLTTFIFVVFVCIATIGCFQAPCLSLTELGNLFSLFLIFGMSAIPFAYLISLSANQPATGFSRSFVLNLLFGLVLLFVSFILQSQSYSEILLNVFRISPHFSLAYGIHKISRYARINHGRSFGDVLPELLFMLFSGIFFLLLVILSEYKFIGKLVLSTRNLLRKQEGMNYRNVSDVERERKRIGDMSKDELASHNLIVESVTKYYGSFKAVDQVWFGIKSSECFGLLGVNGAGKTTIFKMLTGEELITFGDIYVKGLSLKRNLSSVYKEIGYCPQFDALINDLTGRETLRIFCLLRGVPMAQINGLITELSEAFGLTDHLDKLTANYSGGNKRKLSTTLAILGSPSVIYLDEPTSGMDPVSRRQLWNMVCHIRNAGKSILLTSHSMEECEALCTRLAIMVNGEFKCIGSTQHLKNQYSKGLILKLKLRHLQNVEHRTSNYNASPDSPTENRSAIAFERNLNVDVIKKFVATEFPQSELREEFQDLLTFHIPLRNVKWSQIFGIMEQNRQQLNIEDYSISQTTLEEIFLDFANLQREDKRIGN